MVRARVLAAAALLALVACGAVGAPRHGPERTIAATVERVVDGDTAWFVLDDGSREKVRFIGVDTPESTTRHEPFGDEAAAFTAGRLPVGAQVRLEVDVEERDRYGRLLAYVWLAEPAAAAARDAMLNAILVRDGYASVLTIPPNVAYADLFVALQLEARAAGRGLWAPDP